MPDDQNAAASATPEGSAATPQAEGASQVPAGILTATKVAAGAVATPPLAEGGTPNVPPGWTAALTAEQKANPELMTELGKRFPKGTPDLVNFFVEAKAKPGLTVPNEKATAEERAAYRKAIGVPEKPTDYKLVPGKVPAGFEVPKATVDSLRETAHKLGLSQDQTANMYTWLQLQRLTDAEEAAKSVRSNIQQTTGALKAAWKGNYDLEMGYMERGATRYFTKFPGLADKFSRTGLANDLEVIQMFADIGRTASEPVFVEGQGGPAPTTPVGQRSDTDLAKTMYGDKKPA